MFPEAPFQDILKAVLFSVQLSTLIAPSPPNYNQENPNPKPQNKRAKKPRKTHYQQLPELCFSILGMVKAQPTCIGSFVIPLHKNYLTTATDLKSSSSHCYTGSHIQKKKNSIKGMINFANMYLTVTESGLGFQHPQEQKRFSL